MTKNNENWFKKRRMGVKGEQSELFNCLNGLTHSLVLTQCLWLHVV